MRIIIIFMKIIIIMICLITIFMQIIIIMICLHDSILAILQCPADTMNKAKFMKYTGDFMITFVYFQ